MKSCSGSRTPARQAAPKPLGLAERPGANARRPGRRGGQAASGGGAAQHGLAASRQGSGPHVLRSVGHPLACGADRPCASGAASASARDGSDSRLGARGLPAEEIPRSNPIVGCGKESSNLVGCNRVFAEGARCAHAITCKVAISVGHIALFGNRRKQTRVRYALPGYHVLPRTPGPFSADSDLTVTANVSGLGPP
jgi:hypothetical protein